MLWASKVYFQIPLTQSIFLSWCIYSCLQLRLIQRHLCKVKANFPFKNAAVLRGEILGLKRVYIQSDETHSVWATNRLIRMTLQPPPSITYSHYDVQWVFEDEKKFFGCQRRWITCRLSWNRVSFYFAISFYVKISIWLSNFLFNSCALHNSLCILSFKVVKISS